MQSTAGNAGKLPHWPGSPARMQEVRLLKKMREDKLVLSLFWATRPNSDNHNIAPLAGQTGCYQVPAKGRACQGLSYECESHT